jgi:uroporphyrinogen decarboxylase
MNSRERIIAALNGDEMDRMPIAEIGVWPETEKRWRNEGLPANVSIEDYFGLDKISLFSYESSLMLPIKVLKDSGDQQIIMDSNGCHYKRWKGIQSPPQFVGSSITCEDEWNKYKSNLTDNIKRFEDFDIDFVWDLPAKKMPKERYAQAKKENQFTVISPTEPCWYFLRLLGEEEALCTMATDPDFAEQIISDYTDFTIDMLKQIFRAGYTFDALWVFSDLAYKNGMLFSPEFFKKRVAPYQKRIFNLAKEEGMKVIYHSDGNVSELIPLLIDVGVDCVQPLEARAGNDVRECLKLYKDKLSYIGNINADVLASSKEDIYHEVHDKVLEAKKSNRYVFHSDHSVPNTVSFDNYQYAIELAKEFGKY